MAVGEAVRGNARGPAVEEGGVEARDVRRLGVAGQVRLARASSGAGGAAADAAAQQRLRSRAWQTGQGAEHGLWMVVVQPCDAAMRL